MRFINRVFGKKILELKKIILKVGHKSGLCVHLGAMKIFRWLSMKKDVVEFVYSCLTC